MKKIKEFFQKIFSVVASFLKMVWGYIVKGFKWLGNTSVMKKVGHVLAYLPKKVDERLDNQQRKSVWGMIFVIPLVIGFIYFFLIPTILTVKYSLSYIVKFQNVPLQTFWVGFNNYIYAFKDFTIKLNYVDYIFPEVLLNSFIEIITDLPVILIFSLIMAVVLNSKFKGRTLIRAIFFMPVIFNSQAIDLAVATRSAMSQIINQNANTIFENMFSFKDFLLQAKLPVKAVNFLSNASNKIYDIISFSGVQILIFLSAIQSVPTNLYEAAKMEGATGYEMFWKITFPMVSPMLLTTAVYTIIDSYTRSTMIQTIKPYANAKSSATTNTSGLTGKGLEYFNFYGKTNAITYKYLSNYGIGAAISMVYSVMVILVIAIVLGVLSKAVFYYDN